MSELKIFKDMEANCANCPFDITEGDIKRCYDDCGDKPNECYECSYLEYYLKSEADRVIAEKDAEIAQLQAMLEERNKQVGELKEERRWRSVSEEMPSADEGYFIALWEDKYPDIGYIGAEDNVIETIRDRGEGHSVEWWMPIPKAPEEAK